MEDYQLVKKDLETKVADSLRSVGLTVTLGRTRREDWLVEAPADWPPQLPMAVEVKSSMPDRRPGDRKPRSGASPTLTHLRQLDDYVFELSGEKAIRLRSLTQDNNPLFTKQNIGPPGMGISFLTTKGALPYSPVTDTPHKGLLVFNGPADIPFHEREEDWLGRNVKTFAEERTFCILSLSTLMAWVHACGSNRERQKYFWNVMCRTFGQCPEPPA